MKPCQSLRLPIFLALFPAASSAWQMGTPGNPGVSPCLPFDPSNTIPWPTDPSYGSAASFGRMVIGKLSSDSETDRDAVIVAGGVAVHSRTTAAYKLLLPITFPSQPGLTDVVDVAILPGGGPAGMDALLATDSRGLLKTSYASSIDPEAGIFANPVVIEGTAWVNAGPFHVENADGQGG